MGHFNRRNSPLNFFEPWVPAVRSPLWKGGLPAPGCLGKEALVWSSAWSGKRSQTSKAAATWFMFRAELSLVWCPRGAPGHPWKEGKIPDWENLGWHAPSSPFSTSKDAFFEWKAWDCMDRAFTPLLSRVPALHKSCMLWKIGKEIAISDKVNEGFDSSLSPRQGSR